MLFAGCGGCSSGAKQAGLQIVAATDIDPDCESTYQKNFRNGKFLLADINRITPEDLLDFGGLSDADFLIGGPPCQGFTSAGAKKWEDPRNSLVKRFVEFVASIKPTWFIMENVEGFLTTRNGFYLAEAVHRLIKSGYWIRVEKVNMAYHGVPQYRKRVFTVGNSLGIRFSFPRPTHLPKQPSSRFPLPNSLEVGLDRLWQDCYSPLVTVQDAISNLPVEVEKEPVEAPSPLTDFQRLMYHSDPLYHHVAKTHATELLERIKILQPGQRMRDLPSSLQHPSYKNRAHRRVMDGTPTEKRGGPPAGLIRLKPDQPCLTISSAAPSEFIHPTYNRLLTLRECARLQTFPDNFVFKDSRTSIASQIGNAIPPLYMKTLIEHILKYDSAVIHADEEKWLGITATYSKGMSPALVSSLAAIERRAREALE